MADADSSFITDAISLPRPPDRTCDHGRGAHHAARLRDAADLQEDVRRIGSKSVPPSKKRQG